MEVVVLAGCWALGGGVGGGAEALVVCGVGGGGGWAGRGEGMRCGSRE